MITSLQQLDPNGHYTYADYLTWKFEEYVELIKGRLMRMAAPNRYHQKVSNNLSYLITKHLRLTPCEIYTAPFDVRLPRFSVKDNKEIITVVQPDICVICDKSKLDDKGCMGAPDLIIEILSPGNNKKEMKDKFQVYEESGVLEYWIIFLTEKSVNRYVLNAEGKYIGLPPLIEDDIATVSFLPGLEINLMDVFED